jgi:hypothetical protein
LLCPRGLTYCRQHQPQHPRCPPRMQEVGSDPNQKSAFCRRSGGGLAQGLGGVGKTSHMKLTCSWGRGWACPTCLQLKFQCRKAEQPASGASALPQSGARASSRREKKRLCSIDAQGPSQRAIRGEGGVGTPHTKDACSRGTKVSEGKRQFTTGARKISLFVSLLLIAPKLRRVLCK